MGSADCPACFEVAPDPAVDMDANHWHAHHAARFLADDARALAYLRSLPIGERNAACTWLFEWGLCNLARAAMMTGRPALNDDSPLPFEERPTRAELERLSYE